MVAGSGACFTSTDHNAQLANRSNTVQVRANTSSNQYAIADVARFVIIYGRTPSAKITQAARPDHPQQA